MFIFLGDEIRAAHYKIKSNSPYYFRDGKKLSKEEAYNWA
jgi:hypothetical protein